MENNNIREVDISTNEFLKLGFMYLIPFVTDDIPHVKEESTKKEDN